LATDVDGTPAYKHYFYGNGDYQPSGAIYGLNATTDSLPPTITLHGADSFSQDTGANQTGSNVRLAGGTGTKQFTSVSNTAGAVTVSISVNAVAYVNFASGTDFVLGSDNTAPQLAVTATNLAAAINANSSLNTLITATPSAAIVYVTPKNSSCLSLTIISNQTGRISFVDGTNGDTSVYGQLTIRGINITTPLTSTWNGQLYSPNGLMIATGAFLGWSGASTFSSSSAGLFTFAPWAGSPTVYLDANTNRMYAGELGSDVTGIGMVVHAQNAWSQATSNKNGNNLNLSPGLATNFFTVLDNLSGIVAVTITVNGTAVTLTSGTNFNLGTDNTAGQLAVTATNLKNAINANGTLTAQLTATSSTVYVYMVPKSGCWSFTISSTQPTRISTTSGTDGAVILSGSGVTTSATGGLTAPGGLSTSNGNISTYGGVQINAGALICRTYGLSSAGTLAIGGYPTIRTSQASFSWTNANVAALGSNLVGSIVITNLPAKMKVQNIIVVIDTPASGTTTLTVSVGRVGANYTDYIVASDAKASANTVYGAVVGDRGTNLTGYDIPSWTTTTAVYVQFVATGANLDQVTGCTGHIDFETVLMI
jgi:filamentous hemagglutinin